MARADCNAQCQAACQTSCVVQANVDCRLHCDIEAFADCKADLITQCNANCGGRAVLVCSGQEGIPPYIGPAAEPILPGPVGVGPTTANTGVVTRQNVEADGGTNVIVDGDSDTWSNGNSSGVRASGRR